MPNPRLQSTPRSNGARHPTYRMAASSHWERTEQSEQYVRRFRSPPRAPHPMTAGPFATHLVSAGDYARWRERIAGGRRQTWCSRFRPTLIRLALSRAPGPSGGDTADGGGRSVCRGLLVASPPRQGRAVPESMASRNGTDHPNLRQLWVSIAPRPRRPVCCYAEWPDEATWRAAFDQKMVYDEPGTRAAFVDAIAEVPSDAEPIFTMTVVDDLLVMRS